MTNLSTYCEKHGVNLVQNDGCAPCERGVEAESTSNLVQLLREARAVVRRDALQYCVCEPPGPQCKYCGPGRALLERIDTALESFSVEPSENQPCGE